MYLHGGAQCKKTKQLCVNLKKENNITLFARMTWWGVGGWWWYSLIYWGNSPGYPAIPVAHCLGHRGAGIGKPAEHEGGQLEGFKI